MTFQLFISRKFKFYSFISMFLLVYVHGYNLNNSYLQPFTITEEPLTFTSFFEYFTANGLFRFRIPMLFAISGYLFSLGDEQPYLKRIGKRTRTLLLPYFIWSAIALLITFLWQQYPLTAQAVFNSQLDQFGDNRPYSQIGWKGMPERWILAPIAFQLWFIRVLFVYNLLYPLLKKAVLKIPKIWFPVCIFLWLTMFGLHFIEGEGLLFFSLGIWLAKRNKDVIVAPGWLNLKWIVPVFLLACTSKSIIAFYALPNNIYAGISLLLLHKITVFTGFVSVWFGCDALVKWCMSRKWFLWISAFSFMIYALHVPLINYTHQLILPHIQSIPFYRLLDYVFLPLLIVLLCIAVGALLRKLLPNVYGVLTGGRGMS
ncbi:MAG: acyltransferase [Chitinophagaceae bacterium]|nr:acyltransferase [Chitinophagaceae bacterium]